MRRAGHFAPTPDVQTAVLERMADAFADLATPTRLGLLLRLAAGPHNVENHAKQ